MELDNQQVNKLIQSHIHDGNLSSRINYMYLLGINIADNLTSATIATTGNTDAYYLANANGQIGEIVFSSLAALTADNTNYITFSVTNLGQDGAGTTAILATDNLNTTKATGGTAIVANTLRAPFKLSLVNNALRVKKGDRLLFRATATGTLANTVTIPIYLISLQLT